MLKFLIALVACMDIAGPCPAAASDKPQKCIWRRTNISSENPSLSYGNTRTLVLPMCPSRDLTHIVQNRVFVRRSNLRNCFSLSTRQCDLRLRIRNIRAKTRRDARDKIPTEPLTTNSHRRYHRRRLLLCRRLPLHPLRLRRDLAAGGRRPLSSANG